MIELAKTSPTFKDASGKVVYNKAEIDPSFVGGDKEMLKYLRANLKYPEAAQDNDIEGTVFVDFIVDQSGNVHEVIASHIVGELVELTLQEEAVRVVSSMPKWFPVVREENQLVHSSVFRLPSSLQIELLIHREQWMGIETTF